VTIWDTLVTFFTTKALVAKTLFCDFLLKLFSHGGSNLQKDILEKKQGKLKREQKEQSVGS
jgi:hypothetical protein